MGLTSDGITAYVAGGLGNQLFILGAAWEQAERLECPLYLDTSTFDVNPLRPYGLDALSVPARHLTALESPWRTVRVPGGRHLPIPRRLPGPVFLERAVERYDPSINRVRPGATVIGYFQSSRYFPTVGSPLVEALWDVPDTPEEARILDELRGRPAITLHLRRGDYLQGPAAAVFVATARYALRAVGLLRRFGHTEGVRVFTDSVEVVRQELGREADGFEFIGPDAALGTIATLKAMAGGTAMIMSNSSYSWWAATLMRAHGSGDELVVAPRPWTGGGSARADLLESDWLTLDAR